MFAQNSYLNIKDSISKEIMEDEPKFYPPKLNPLLVRICQSLSYPFAHCFYHLHLKIDDSCIDKLKSLGDKRIVLLPNHSTFDDAISLHLLSARWGELFHYLVAYDSFEGFLKEFLPRMGCYSIQRGVGDRASIAQTLKLLQQPDIRLTIFPEGGCSFQNDTVMPFRTGAVQLPFQALSKLVKSEETIPDFYLVPISIKYIYKEDMTEEIERTLSHLEKHLNISSSTTEFYTRLRMVGEKILVRLEKEYGLEPSSSNDNWTKRLNRLKFHVLAICEDKLDITPPPETPVRERVYKIQSVLEERAQNWTEIEGETYNFISKATFRLLNFDAIYDGYVADFPTPERYLDTLTRLERAIFNIDQPKPKANRNVYIRVGDAVNLKDHFESYKENRTETIEKLTNELQNRVQKNIDLINAGHYRC